jgi:hypothetical protein
MQAHLEEIGRTVAAGAHAVLLMDRAASTSARGAKHALMPDNPEASGPGSVTGSVSDGCACRLLDRSGKGT